LHLLKAGGGLLDVFGEVGHLLNLADFDDFAVHHGAAGGPVDSFLAGIDFDDPVAAEDFFGFREGAVDDCCLFVFEGDSSAHGGRVEAVELEKYAGFLHVFVVFHHGGDGVGGGDCAGLGFVVIGGDD